MRPTQAELDDWLGSSADERAVLRGGQLPPRLRGHQGGHGCAAFAIVVVAAFVFGGVATAARMVLNRQLEGVLTPWQCAVIGVAFGAALGWWSLRKLRAAGERASRVPVFSELIELKAEPAPGAAIRLLAPDGRSFRTIALTGRLNELEGDYLVYYADFGSQLGLPGAAGDKLLLALELPAAASK